MTRWRAVWFKYWIPIALMPRTLWSAWAIEIPSRDLVSEDDTAWFSVDS